MRRELKQKTRLFTQTGFEIFYKLQISLTPCLRWYADDDGVIGESSFFLFDDAKVGKKINADK